MQEEREERKFKGRGRGGWGRGGERKKKKGGTKEKKKDRPGKKREEKKGGGLSFSKTKTKKKGGGKKKRKNHPLPPPTNPSQRSNLPAGDERAGVRPKVEPPNIANQADAPPAEAFQAVAPNVGQGRLTMTDIAHKC